MKRALVVFMVLSAFMLASCEGLIEAFNYGRFLVDDAEKLAAVDVDAVVSDRTDASGPKIASNAHSDDFPGIIFFWDSKQENNGYLIVENWVFDRYASFTLTAKMASEYFDFVIAVQDRQIALDDCYIFYIPAVNGKNINMVFITGWVMAPVGKGCVHCMGGYPGQKCDDCDGTGKIPVTPPETPVVNKGKGCQYCFGNYYTCPELMCDGRGCDGTGVPIAPPVKQPVDKGCQHCAGNYSEQMYDDRGCCRNRNS